MTSKRLCSVSVRARAWRGAAPGPPVHSRLRSAHVERRRLRALFVCGRCDELRPGSHAGRALLSCPCAAGVLRRRRVVAAAAAARRACACPGVRSHRGATTWRAGGAGQGCTVGTVARCCCARRACCCARRRRRRHHLHARDPHLSAGPVRPPYGRRCAPRERLVVGSRHALGHGQTHAASAARHAHPRLARHCNLRAWRAHPRLACRSKLPAWRALTHPASCRSLGQFPSTSSRRATASSSTPCSPALRGARLRHSLPYRALTRAASKARDGAD